MPDSDTDMGCNVDCRAALTAAETTVTRGGPLDRAVLVQWMTSPCVDVRSLAFAVLFDPPDGARLPEQDAVAEFFLRHLGGLMRDDQRSDRTPGPYLAGQLLRAWFQRLWRAGRAPVHLLSRIRDLLADLVRTGDQRARDVVVLGVLEHLFTEPSIAAFFRCWDEDPALADAFRDAVHLADAEGSAG